MYKQCDNCDHSKVCKLKEKYHDVLDKIRVIDTQEFCVKLDCGYHKITSCQGNSMTR